MKQSRVSVNEKAKKRIGRPPRVEGVDPAIAVRLPKAVLAQVDRLVTDKRKRSDVIREMVVIGLLHVHEHDGKAARKKR